MQFLLTLLAAYVASTNAAPVTVTHTVVMVTQYVTSTISSSPYSSSATSSFTESASVVIPPSSEVPTTPTTPATVTPTTPATVTPTTSSTTTTSVPEPTSTLNAFESAILNEHNIKRALHGVNSLTWDSTLAQFAANYAANSFSCDNVQLIHSGGPYGENLAAGYVGGAAPVDAWYDEIRDYDFSNPGFSEATGHFTQVVWASTTKVGCAQVTCNNAWQQYTICEYSPAGNVIGYFAENVFPPTS
ncbi:hypothetical protein JCM33374_g5040 [Metschnikowia sp. JCM 33374]|nr:hypothetical protein JCM33374_g5040 [Metschnikowia sp. JCM 33374]